MLKNLKKKKNNKGFTLVELLVVIAIIGVLAVVAVPSLFKQIDKAKATQVVANIKAIQTEIMTEYASENTNDKIVTEVTKFITANIIDKKLSESYEVEVSDTDINIIVTMTDKDDIAVAIANQLGDKGEAVDSVVTYTISK